MFDEGLEESDEMDNELEEYLSLFKNTSETKVKRTSSSTGRIKPKVHQKSLPQLKSKPSFSLKNKMVSCSDESLTSSLQQNLKIYNLQELSSTISSVQPEDNSIRPSEDTSSAMGNLVLTLKDLAPSEATLNKSKSDTEEDTTFESFNIKANIFTVEDLVVSEHSYNVRSVSSEVVDECIDKSAVSEKLVEDGVKFDTECHDKPIYRDDFEDITTYKDDFEQIEYNDDFEDEDSQKDKESSDESVDERIEEEGQVSNDATEDHSGSYDDDDDKDSGSAMLGSSRSNSDTKQYTSDTDEISQTIQCSEDSSSTTGDVSKTEVAVQTDPWHMTSQLDALLSEEPAQCSNAGTMALHNLITQQLELTRSLIATAQSLHHSKTLAIRPDYHYVTLEDTKQFIKEHKPKVLRRKRKKKSK